MRCSARAARRGSRSCCASSSERRGATPVHGTCAFYRGTTPVHGTCAFYRGATPVHGTCAFYRRTALCVLPVHLPGCICLVHRPVQALALAPVTAGAQLRLRAALGGGGRQGGRCWEGGHLRRTLGGGHGVAASPATPCTLAATPRHRLRPHAPWLRPRDTGCDPTHLGCNPTHLGCNPTHAGGTPRI